MEQLQLIQDFFYKNNITIRVDGDYIRLIFAGEVVGQVYSSVGEYDVITASMQTRSSELHAQNNVLNIHALDILPTFGGRKYGTLLLIYCILYRLIHNNLIQTAILDDMSARSNYINNIYNSVGFAPTGLVSLMSKQQIGQTGPEKQLDINYFKNIYVNKIKEITSNGGGRNKRKTKRKSFYKKRSNTRNRRRSKYARKY